MSKEKISYEKLKTAVALCAGVAVLVGIATILVDGSYTRLAVEPQSVTAATTLGFSQGIVGFYPSSNGYYPTSVAPATPQPTRCHLTGSQTDGYVTCSTVAPYYVPNSYYIDRGFLGFQSYSPSDTYKATQAPVGVFSARPQGVMTGMSKTGWYRDPYTYRGTATTPTDAGCANQYCAEGGYNECCAWGPKGDCTAMCWVNTCTTDPTVMYSSAGPQGAGCYQTYRPSSPGGTTWGWQNTTVGTAVSVPASSNITLEWSCQYEVSQHFSYDCGLGNVCGGTQNIARIFDSGGVLYRDGTALGVSGQYGTTNVTVPATPGTYNYQLTCFNSGFGTFWTGSSYIYNLVKGDDMTLTIPITVTESSPIPTISPTNSSVAWNSPQTLTYSLANATDVTACVTRQVGESGGYPAAIGSGSTTTKPITGSTQFEYACFKSPTWYVSTPPATVDATMSGPSITTNAATDVTETSATLNGTGNPNGSATTGWFRYSTTNPGTCNDTFGTRAPASGGSALGSGGSSVPFSQGISGLSPNSTYYFCAIGQSGAGTAFGGVLSFTTAQTDLCTDIPDIQNPVPPAPCLTPVPTPGQCVPTNYSWNGTACVINPPSGCLSVGNDSCPGNAVTSVRKGENAEVFWSIQGAGVSCTVTSSPAGLFSGSGTSGNTTLNNVQQKVILTIVCSNAGGSFTDTATINLIPTVIEQ